ncbi:MAG: NmrA family NAD(P)-binding protein [Marinicaulis sp.]|nr:NmrA family NAD(P)-binding protein [Marinicaulis sp.]
MENKRILVVGAGGALGLEIVRGLRAQNISVTATYRMHRPSMVKQLSALGAELVQLDLRNEAEVKQCLVDVDGVVFIPILTASKDAAQLLRDTQHAVFFSSNNVSIDPENDTYARLLEAEEETRKNAPHAVILRPTMIYGYAGDGNLSRLMKLMRKFPIIPMPGSGQALQQPVFYKDLAQIAIRSVLCRDLNPGIYAVAGPEAISQRRLYAEIAKAAGGGRKVMSVPIKALTFAILMLEKLGIKPPVSSAQLDRAERNKAPSGVNVVLAPTSLPDGLKSLAEALDAVPHDT